MNLCHRAGFEFRCAHRTNPVYGHLPLFGAFPIIPPSLNGTDVSVLAEASTQNAAAHFDPIVLCADCVAELVDFDDVWNELASRADPDQAECSTSVIAIMTAAVICQLRLPRTRSA